MTFLKRYLIPRLIQYFLVIWLGITIVFLIPRLTPNDPVMRMIGEMRGRGFTLEPVGSSGLSMRFFSAATVSCQKWTRLRHSRRLFSWSELRAAPE